MTTTLIVAAEPISHRIRRLSRFLAAASILLVMTLNSFMVAMSLVLYRNFLPAFYKLLFGSEALGLFKSRLAPFIDALAEANPLQVICLDEGFKHMAIRRSCYKPISYHMDHTERGVICACGESRM